MKPAREPAPIRSKPCASLKNASRIFARSPLLVGPRKKKTDRDQRSAFLYKQTSLFAPLVLAPKGSALPWLVDDRAALRPRRMRCLFTQQYMQQHVCVCCRALPGFLRQCPLPLACHYLPKGTKLELGRGAHHPQPTKPPPRFNRPAESQRQPVGCIS